MSDDFGQRQSKNSLPPKQRGLGIPATINIVVEYFGDSPDEDRRIKLLAQGVRVGAGFDNRTGVRYLRIAIEPSNCNKVCQDLERAGFLVSVILNET